MKKIKQRDYERASQLLGKLFDVDSDIVKQINTRIHHNGICEFFKNLDAYDFTNDVHEKLTAIRQILFGERTEAMPKYLLDEYVTKCDAPEGGGLK